MNKDNASALTVKRCFLARCLIANQWLWELFSLPGNGLELRLLTRQDETEWNKLVPKR
jgi:hypothetical protein